MIKLKNTYLVFLIFSYSTLFYSCANQLPPTGGQEDKNPPEIKSITPKANSVNFKGNKINIIFNEYVERRSFEESFFISPKPKGPINFSWSGKEVDIEFSKNLDLNKTYVIIIGKEFKDLRGGNAISTPLSYAFSTGIKIDEGKISGKVISDNYDKTKILLYLKSDKVSDSLNPEINIPDYVLQVSSDGGFKFTNLPDGEYRIFAISDEDRNNLFDKDFDKIGILYDDIKLGKDSADVSGLSFLLKEFELNKNSKDFTNLLKSDSGNYIYSNIVNEEKNVPPDYKFYFYFSKNNITKADIVNNFSITDSVSAKSYRLVFNWINDSLLEVFSTEKFKELSNLKLNIDLTNTLKKCLYSRVFAIAGKNSTGKLSGKVISDEKIISSVYIKLYNKDNKLISFSQKISDTTGFIFNEVPEGNYTLFSFIDENEDGKPDTGEHYPFRSSEKFIIYDKDLKVKGGWNVENVFLKF